MNHLWTQISYSTPYEAHLKTKGCMCQKRRKLQWNCKGSFFITESAEWAPRKTAYSEHLSYSFSINGGLSCNRHTGCDVHHARETSFCDFWKMTLQVHCIFLIFDTSKLFFRLFVTDALSPLIVCGDRYCVHVHVLVFTLLVLSM